MLSSIVVNSYSSLISYFDSIELLEETSETKDKLENEKQEESEIYCGFNRLIFKSNDVYYHFQLIKATSGFYKEMLDPPIA